ncbi:hypothetical protein [Methylorubrum salsuginis]|uniref:hypothetical protein n=1 Tax=Methylorubrum salsuginis TaxID=414703 RepID=UPI0010422ACA|nr:hypothetical protein [Methylorubrum salsuginis]
MKRALKICAKFAFAYIAAVYVGLVVAMMPILHIFSPALALLFFMYVPIIPTEFPGFLFWLPIPTFISLIVSGKIFSDRFQKKWDRRKFFVNVGGIAGGITTSPMLPYHIYASIQNQKTIEIFSFGTVCFLCMAGSGIPAGMVLGRLMASSVVELFRPSPRTAP